MMSARILAMRFPAAVLACLLSLSLPTFAQTVEYEKVLFPVVASRLPGAFGSLWETEVAVLNRSATPVRLAGRYACYGCRTAQSLLPDMTYSLLPDQSVTGSFVFVERGRADDVEFTSRIRDISREESSWGASVPVAREHDFSTKGITLLDVPTDPRYRLTLRIYALHPLEGASVVVRVRAQHPGIVNDKKNPDPLLAEAAYPLTPMIRIPTAPEQYPSYAIISELPPIAPETLSPRVRIDLVPLAPEGLAIWGFVTITNNDSQSVTIVSGRSRS
jgi:hypothetical protein